MALQSILIQLVSQNILVKELLKILKYQKLFHSTHQSKVYLTLQLQRLMDASLCLIFLNLAEVNSFTQLFQESWVLFKLILNYLMERIILVNARNWLIRLSQMHLQDLKLKLKIQFLKRHVYIPIALSHQWLHSSEVSLLKKLLKRLESILLLNNGFTLISLKL